MGAEQHLSWRSLRGAVHVINFFFSRTSPGPGRVQVLCYLLKETKIQDEFNGGTPVLFGHKINQVSFPKNGRHVALTELAERSVRSRYICKM